MARHRFRFALTIPSGQTASNALTISAALGTLAAVTIYTPAVLTSTTVTVQVAEASGTFVNFSSGGADVTVSTISKGFNIPVPACEQLRLLGNSAEAADRAFVLEALLEVL